MHIRCNLGSIFHFYASGNNTILSADKKNEPAGFSNAKLRTGLPCRIKLSNPEVIV